MGVHFCRFEWIKMGRQSDQVERAACSSGGFENNKWSLQRSIHEMQKYFVKNFPEYLDRE